MSRGALLILGAPLLCAGCPGPDGRDSTPEDSAPTDAPAMYSLMNAAAVVESSFRSPTSMLPVGDQDGDGLGELVIAGYERASLLHGPIWGRSSWNIHPNLVGDADFTSLDAIDPGDQDGDGLGDLLLLGDDVAYLLLGPLSTGASFSDPDGFLAVREDDDLRWGHSPDLTGDGFGDLLVAHHEDLGLRGRVYLMAGPLGRNTGTSDAAAVLLGTERFDHAGYDLDGDIGDVDGDGFGDLLIGAARGTDADDSEGRAYLVSGPLEGSYDLGQSTATLFGDGSLDSRWTGEQVEGPGDLNQDGHADILVADNDRIWLFSGPLEGNQRADVATATIEFAYAWAPLSLEGGHDVDGDGYPDLVCADGRGAWILAGPLSGVVQPEQHAMVALVFPDEPYEQLVISWSTDLTGDGVKDLLFFDAAWGHPDDYGRSTHATIVVSGAEL